MKALHGTGGGAGSAYGADSGAGDFGRISIRMTFGIRMPVVLRDLAISDVYEPGSTFKLVTYSAALEEHVTTPESTLKTLGGQINVAGRIVHDDRDAIRYEAQHGNVLTTTEALEQSSDVAAIELAQRMGADRFYQYIKSYGFGERSGIELPAETRGLLKPVRRWEPTTIGSIPMGQEVGVTPLQLITMASTIANGGEYLPPHILLQSSGEAKSGQLEPAAFHPEHEIANPLPDGAHRVISTLTAAQMRKMMEGVVLDGTGKAAQLNGYSAAGKTGTAEKIDPRTHTYSKTKYVASFVGFAPVNDPAITMVIVMDSPQASMHYGASASAPMFHELAQQILEYLGVPHDQDLKTTLQMAAVESQPMVEEEPAEHIDDLNSLFDEVNRLPADDPLRIKQDTAALLPLSKTDSGVRPAANSNVAAERASVTAPDVSLSAPQSMTDDNAATPTAPQKDSNSSPALPPPPLLLRRKVPLLWVRVKALRCLH